MTDKKAHIVNVAIELFSKNGFEGTSMRDLASAAGVNIAMINYYFGTKEKLFETIVESRSNQMRIVLEAVVQDKKMSAIQKVEKMIELQVEKVLERRHFHKVLQSEVMLNKRPDLNTAIGVIFKRNSLLYRTIIDEGYKSGEFKKVDAGLVVSTIVGTINHVFLSRTICGLVFETHEGTDPFEDVKIKKKVIDYLKHLMRCLLLK
ncbi:TetR/AcrR family transcriptional regulator [Arachidicoccus sp.]|uniref:TetR/AcrR family transcriptional regulator n=1 Tax=Arachidicoccus sp. TaxID=1872624 RepID=UPI003D2015D9